MRGETVRPHRGAGWWARHLQEGKAVLNHSALS